MRPQKVSFPVDGCRLTGYLTRPAGGTRPAIVMAHGFSGTQAGSLARTAADFADAGFAVLTFDYRGFGESEGQPRQVIDLSRQRQDWRAALAFLRSLDGIDGERIALWGSSLSGAHVVRIAADDPRIAAVVAQVPFNGFPPAKTLNRTRGEALRLFGAALVDGLRGLLGLSPLTVPVVGPVHSPAVIVTERSAAILEAMRATHWENRVAPRVLLAMAFGRRPETVAHRLAMPLLVCVAEDDRETPADLGRRLARRAPQGEVRSFACSHFDFYAPPWREAVVAEQILFLNAALRQGRAGPSPAGQSRPGR